MFGWKLLDKRAFISSEEKLLFEQTTLPFALKGAQGRTVMLIHTSFRSESSYLCLVVLDAFFKYDQA